MADAGLLSRETTWRELRRRNLLDSATFDEEAELIRLDRDFESSLSNFGPALREDGDDV